MPSRRAEPLLRINCFEVLIGDREVGFAEVSRLSSETALRSLDEPAQGFESIVLKRALTTDTELYDWRRAIVAGKDDRRDVTIRQLAAPGGPVVNTWRLVRAWPCRWSGPAFDAMDASIACEEIELSFDDLVWLARTSSRGG